VLATLVFLALLAGETVADQQRWTFHRTQPAGPGGGTLRTGLFRYSRHPNYFCELGQWWTVLTFAVIAARTPWLPTASGAVLLTLLFLGSTLFTEHLSVRHHADYDDYRRSTSMLIPWRPRPILLVRPR
jgi:steroid 5-alpha reductase family enzyme